MTRLKKNILYIVDEIGISPSSFAVYSSFLNDNNVTRPFITAASVKVEKASLDVVLEIGEIE